MYQIQARKSLGQHFLKDKSILTRIATAAKIQQGDFVIEIGPGTGLLTQKLLETPLGHLTAFEVDARVIPGLQEAFKTEGDRFEIVEEDVLKVDLSTIAATAGKKLRVVGNIPYYITSPILFQLIDARSSIRDALLLVQLEVAERLVAEPRTKAYGIPTVITNFFGEAKLLFRVPRGAFRPMPNVDSAVVHIDFERGFFARTGLQPNEGFSEKHFQSFIRGLFRMRRKTIRNNLKGLVLPEGIEKLESSQPILPGRRAEELGIPELLDLYQIVTPDIHPN